MRARRWSSWYNQPTGQFYHVSTDNLFPYRVYGGAAGQRHRRRPQPQRLRRDSAAGLVLDRRLRVLPSSRPIPAHPNYVYSGGWYGSVVRYDKTPARSRPSSSAGKKYRASEMPPLVFSPQDPRVLYLGTQFVLKTTDGGKSWQEISPDLTGYVEKRAERRRAEARAWTSRVRRRITALVAFARASGEIWAGTSNRLVQLTRDGGNELAECHPRRDWPSPTEILYVEASHHDAGDGLPHGRRDARIDAAQCSAHPRLRQDLAEDRQRVSRRRNGARGARRSQAQRAALRGNRYDVSSSRGTTAITGSRLR